MPLLALSEARSGERGFRFGSFSSFWPLNNAGASLPGAGTLDS
jgi:hypothetical protein